MLDRFERWFPAIAGAVSLAIYAIAIARGWDVDLAKQFDLSQVMGVTFNVIAFATPLAVALFAITLAPGGGFIQKLFGTKAYSLFVNYVIWAIGLGALAMLATAPYLITRSTGSVSVALSQWVALWWFLMTAAMAAVARVLLIFFVWARSYSKPKQTPEGTKSGGMIKT
jgi:hypothetical protein